jgi:hypothetical protein
LGSRGIRLFAFELKHEEQNDRSKFPGDSELEQMAANTGGLTIIYAPTDGAFIDKNGKPSRTTIALREQYGLFLTFDLLTITLPESPHRPETWKLALVDSQAAQKGINTALSKDRDAVRVALSKRLQKAFLVGRPHPENRGVIGSWAWLRLRRQIQRPRCIHTICRLL